MKTIKTPLHHSPFHPPTPLPLPFREGTTVNSLGGRASPQQWVKGGGCQPGCLDQVSILLLIICETSGKLLYLSLCLHFSLKIAGE